jgi:hypothetical protein
LVRAILPAAAAGAVKGEFPKATVAGVEAEGEGNAKLYEVKLSGDPAEAEMTVAGDGTVVEVKTAVKVADLPKAVADSVTREAAGGTVKSVGKQEVRASAKLVNLPAPRVSYEVVLVKGLQKRELELSADGKVME